MQAAKPKATTSYGTSDQWIRAMAAETHLTHKPRFQGPVQEHGSIPFDRPMQVFLSIQTMDRQTVQRGASQAFKACRQVRVALGPKTGLEGVCW